MKDNTMDAHGLYTALKGKTLQDIRIITLNNNSSIKLYENKPNNLSLIIYDEIQGAEEFIKRYENTIHYDQERLGDKPFGFIDKLSRRITFCCEYQETQLFFSLKDIASIVVNKTS